MKERALESIVLNNFSKINLNTITDVSLHGGKSGIILLYAYMYMYFKDEEYIEKANLILNSILSDIQNCPPGFSTGYQGLSWVIVHLMNIDALNFDDNLSVLKSFKSNCLNISKYFFSEGNIDQMHGALGGALFFLEAKNLFPVRRYLSFYVKQLNLLAIKSQDILYWNTPFAIENKNSQIDIEEVNLGYAHGLPGQLKILSSISTMLNSEQKAICENIVRKGVNYLLSFKSESNETISLFPIAGKKQLKEKDYSSRLGWCYGDLTIAFSMWEVGKNINDNFYKKKAVEIGLKCAKRRLENSGVVDPFLCHGSAGIAHIFKIFYNETKQREFLSASQFWNKKTLLYIEKNTYSDPGLLTGISGVILHFLSMMKWELHTWNRCLFL